MQKLFLNRRQLYWFIGIAAFITIPLGFLTVIGEMDGETGMILFMPVVLGLPWNLIYLILLILPIKIEGINSGGTGEPLALWQLLLFFMVPLYINIYLLIKGVGKIVGKTVVEEERALAFPTIHAKAKFWNFKSARYYVSYREKLLDVVVGIIFKFLIKHVGTYFIFITMKAPINIIFALHIFILFTLLFYLKKRRFIACGYALGFLLTF